VVGVYNKVMNFRSIDPRDQRTGMTGGGAMDRRAWAEYYDSSAGAIDEPRLSSEFHRLWGSTSQTAPVEDVGAPDVALDAEVRRLCSFDLETLVGRYRATSKNKRSAPPAKPTVTREFARDPLVVAIAKVRADFKCEVAGCRHPMFMDAGNRPYCEVHHIGPLGVDDPDNVACLCPAHHREVHHGKAAAEIRDGLIELRQGVGGQTEPVVVEVPT
jgi:hypothetical protein